MNYTTADYLEQLQQDREDLVDNLEAKGITGLTGDETFTELVPEVLNISGGGSIDDYMKTTVDGNVDNYLYVNIPVLMKQIPHLDITNVQVFDNFFENCQHVTSIDLSGIDTTGVTSFFKMFNNCRAVTSLDVSGFDTSSGESFYGMFYECRSLQSLDVSNFDLSSAYGVSDMFGSCYALESVTFGNNFVGSGVEDTNGMFRECFELTSLDLSMFAPTNLQYANGMFYNCMHLVDLDISGMDMTNITDTFEMFTEMPDNAIVKVKDVANQQWVLNLGSDDRPTAWTTSNVIVA